MYNISHWDWEKNKRTLERFFITSDRLLCRIEMPSSHSHPSLVTPEEVVAVGALVRHHVEGVHAAGDARAQAEPKGGKY